MWAWGNKGRIVAVFSDATEEQVRNAAGTYDVINVPTDTLPGAYWNGSSWINDTTTNNPRVISSINFIQRFSFQERAALKSLKTTDPLVDILWDSIFDPRLIEINLDHPETVMGLQYLTTINNPITNAPVLTTERLTQILL